MSEERRPTVLIVDDAPENLKLLGEILVDYTKKIATGGEKALEIAGKGNKPDIILLDIMMPGMDGYEVLCRLKADPHTADIPVIFITGKTGVDDETRGLELGAVDFIPKPFSAPVVLARIKNHLELSRAHKLVIQQNEALEERNKFITDSIRYAKKIQTAMLPSRAVLDKLFPENFLIYKPKDIISGDFFWMREVGGKNVIAVIDCTGHGVPGALMSMIGNTLLNEIIYIQKILDPGKILAELDRRVITELNKDHHSDALDCMDVCLCVIDTDKMELQFGGAGRPLYFILNGEVNEIKGVRKSIGERGNEKTFVTLTMPLSRGMHLYLATDGFGDQNDRSGNKFSTKRIREDLMSMDRLPMKEQGAAMLQNLEEHMGDEEQRDDITMIGIRL